jgi:hypothetical protein
MQGFIAVFEDIAQLYDGANPYKPDPKLEAQAEALVKKCADKNTPSNPQHSDTAYPLRFSDMA